jgi:hypothetical protein
MKAQVKVSPSVVVELEAPKQKDLFKVMASAFEVFGVKRCALCGSNDIVPVWRNVTKVEGKKMEEYEYPEYHCKAVDEEGRRCGARLALGTINDDTGTLFPIRKLVDTPQGMRPPNKEEKKAGKGSFGPHDGWHRYVPKGGED